MLEFAKEKSEDNLVKMVSGAVPNDVLPAGDSAVLVDLKVDGGHASDDEIYDNHSEIRKMASYIRYSSVDIHFDVKTIMRSYSLCGA